MRRNTAIPGATLSVTSRARAAVSRFRGSSVSGSEISDRSMVCADAAMQSVPGDQCVRRRRERTALLATGRSLEFTSIGPFPTFPSGFPSEVIEAFARQTGRGVIGNVVGSGTDVINRFAAEQRATGSWIVYTSADSVFQIAADEQDHSARRALPRV